MREMRRSDRKLGNDEIVKILQSNQYGILSTIGADGYPYGVPLTYIYDDGELYFHSALEGQKLDNLQNSNKASFCVVGDTELLPGQFSTRYESVIVFGEVEELVEEEKTAVLSRIVDRLAPDFREKGVNYIKAAGAKARVFRLKAAQITGKARR